MKFKVFVYHRYRRGCASGEIEERTVVDVSEHKVVYDEEDQYGYIGAKQSVVFFTREQAENAKRLNEILGLDCTSRPTGDSVE